MRIALAQINSPEGDFASTIERMCAYAQAASQEGSDLVVFPLPVLTGPLAKALASNHVFLFDTLEALRQAAQMMPIPALVPVATDIDEDSFYDVALLSEGKVQLLRLSNMDAGSLEGTDIPIHDLMGREPASTMAFSYAGLRFGIVFGYPMLDRSFNEDRSIDVCLYYDTSGFDYQRSSSALGASVEQGCFVQQAKDLHTWIVACGSVGAYGDSVYTGSSFVMTPQGQLVSLGSAFSQELLIADIDSEATDVISIDASLHAFQREEWLWKALQLCIAEAFQKQQRDKLLVACEGDLVSSLLLELAIDTLGCSKVHCIIPDYAENSQIDCLHQHYVCQDMEISRIPVEGGRDSCQFRLALSQLSKVENALILVPDTKTDLAINADSHELRNVRSYAPFGDIYFCQVARLAWYKNCFEDIINLTDAPLVNMDLSGMETATPLSEKALLNKIDQILYLYIEGGKSLTATAQQVKEEVLTTSVLAAFREGEFARRLMPIIPKLTCRSLRELEFPLGLAWSDRARTNSDEDIVKDIVHFFKKHLDEDVALEKGENKQYKAGPLPDKEVSQISKTLRFNTAEGKARKGRIAKMDLDPITKMELIGKPLRDAIMSIDQMLSETGQDGDEYYGGGLFSDN